MNNTIFYALGKRPQPLNKKGIEREFADFVKRNMEENVDRRKLGGGVLSDADIALLQKKALSRQAGHLNF